MMSGPEILDFHAARALLEWQLELGADEPVGDAPINRYDLAAEAPKAAKTQAAPPLPAAAIAQGFDPVQVAKNAAAGATSLEALAEV
ncbi:MAG: uracil-DNA glycosylase, partial [Paracoccaceae bacterium]